MVNLYSGGHHFKFWSEHYRDRFFFMVFPSPSRQQLEEYLCQAITASFTSFSDYYVLSSNHLMLYSLELLTTNKEINHYIA